MVAVSSMTRLVRIVELRFEKWTPVFGKSNVKTTRYNSGAIPDSRQLLQATAPTSIGKRYT